MSVRPTPLLLVLCLAGLGGGCHRAVAPEIEVPAAPDAIANLDEFEAVFNRYVLIEEGHRGRESYRAVLVGFLLEYIDKELAENDTDEALSALQYAVAIYTPGELRKAPAHPELARRAHAIYRAAARTGAENPSFLALAVEQRFGDEAGRKRALKNWERLESWMTENGPYSTEPVLRHEELEQSLEQVAAAFPSPFVTKRVADLYVARYAAAKRSRNLGQGIGTASQRRMEITGYLLMRLYLRADDLDGAIEAMGRVELDPPVAKLREILVETKKPHRTAMPWLALAEQFVPVPESDPSESFVVQGWGIVDNLARRAIRDFPKDPYAHLLRARALATAGLTGAAVEHLRRTIELKKDIFEAWEAVAELEQRRLVSLAQSQPEAAAKHLPKIEELHQQAVKQWPDRPISPGLPAAYFVVAEGLYQVGEVDRAEALLRRSLAIEPVPDSLDLLGTIELKESKLSEAQSRYENLASMAYDSEVAQLRWEARARQQLGEIAMRKGDAQASTRHIRLALRHTNDLLARSQAGLDDRADRFVDRGKLLFMLGDVELAMDDFRTAAELAPDNVKAYADPLRSVVAHGYYEEARSIFRRAMARAELSDSLKLYFSLWMNELALRQGHAPEPEARQFLAEYRGDAWGRALASHARGELEFDQLLARAEGKGERAEAYFYEGLRQWRLGEPAAAKKLMQQVIDTKMMGFFEYDMALAYLSWGELPRVARPALPTNAAKRTHR